MVETTARIKALFAGGNWGLYTLNFPKTHPLPAQNDKHPWTHHHTRARNVLRWGTIFTPGVKKSSHFPSIWVKYYTKPICRNQEFFFTSTYLLGWRYTLQICVASIQLKKGAFRTSQLSIHGEKWWFTMIESAKDHLKKKKRKSFKSTGVSNIFSIEFSQKDSLGWFEIHKNHTTRWVLAFRGGLRPIISSTFASKPNGWWFPTHLKKY